MVSSFSDTYQTNGLHFRLTQPDLRGNPPAYLISTA